MLGIASIPVSAEQPAAKAFRTRITPTASHPGGLRGADHRRRVRAHQADGDDTEECGQEHRL